MARPRPGGYAKASQTVLTPAKRKWETAVAALRPQADALIRAVRAAVLYATYEMDEPSQRRVLRNYGSVYRYLPGEAVDVGDGTIKDV